MPTYDNMLRNPAVENQAVDRIVSFQDLNFILPILFLISTDLVKHAP